MLLPYNAWFILHFLFTLGVRVTYTYKNVDRPWKTCLATLVNSESCHENIIVPWVDISAVKWRYSHKQALCLHWFLLCFLKSHIPNKPSWVCAIWCLNHLLDERFKLQNKQHLSLLDVSMQGLKGGDSSFRCSVHSLNMEDYFWRAD